MERCCRSQPLNWWEVEEGSFVSAAATGTGSCGGAVAGESQQQEGGFAGVCEAQCCCLWMMEDAF